MRFTFPFLICTVSLSALTCAKGADVQATFQAKYDALAKAFAKKDLTPFDKALSPKFVLVGIDGSKIDRKTILADYKRQTEMMSEVNWVRTVQKPTLTGLMATVSVKSHLKSTVTLQGKKHLYELSGTTKDIWTRKGLDWTLTKSQVLSLDATLDGRRMNRA